MSDDACVVLARFREDVDWARDLGLPVIVYDKSGTKGPHALPNIGREAHTYLHHILHRYPHFPAYTFFFQADPFVHLPTGTSAQDLARMMAEMIARRVGFKGFAGYSIRCDGLGRPHALNVSGKWAGRSADIPVGEVYARLFSGPIPRSFHTRAPAGLFGVHRDRILCRPRELYETAMNLVLADPDDEHNTGHALERLWYLVFNGYAALNKTAYV